MKKSLCIVLLALSFNLTNAQALSPLLTGMLQDTLDFYVGMISNIKGMSASVYLPNQGMWQGTAGVSYAGQPITPEMEFGIASNSKLFVAATMLKLQEGNMLSLDDSLHKWLPTYPNVNPDITIRQLLNHTSGVDDPIFVSPFIDTLKANPTRYFTKAEVLSYVGSPSFAPGTGYEYSNVNYILAGMVAESATGFPISQLIRDSILTPLDMDSTFFDVEESATGVISHRWWDAVDYHDTSRVSLNSAGGCAGALFSTSSEMAQWYTAILGGSLLDAGSMAELLDFGPTTSPVLDYGLGITRETTMGRTYWGHGGSTWGYRSKMIYDSCMGATVCGLTNSFPSGMDAVTFLLYRVLLNHLPQCAGTVAGPSVVCQGETGVTFTVPAVAGATSYTWTLPAGATGTSATNIITVDFGLAAVSGNITVRGDNAYGGGGSSSLSITVNPKPPTPVITETAGTLHSSAPAGNQWYNSAGLIPGATSQDYVVTVDDTYYVVVTLAGCVSDSSNNLAVVLDGVADERSPVSFIVYPNPTSWQFTIDLPEAQQQGDYILLNSLGQVLLQGSVKGSATIHAELLPAGLYTLRVQVGAQSFDCQKVLKQ